MSDDNDLCAVCNKPGPLVYAACKTAHYCSSKCQKEDWKEHKAACKAIQEAKASTIIPVSGSAVAGCSASDEAGKVDPSSGIRNLVIEDSSGANIVLDFGLLGVGNVLLSSLPVWGRPAVLAGNEYDTWYSNFRWAAMRLVQPKEWPDPQDEYVLSKFGGPAGVAGLAARQSRHETHGYQLGLRRLL